MSRDEPRKPDAFPTALLRAVLGGAVEGGDRLLDRLGGSRGAGEDAELARVRHALLGLLFDVYGAAARGASLASDVTFTAGRIGWAIVGPIARSPLLRPLVGPPQALIERWVRIGRDEERRSRSLARELAGAPVDEIVRYLRENPETAALVRQQAETLLAQLPDSPVVDTLVRKQGDRYVEHLRENPEPVQELVQGQSVGLIAELADSLRERAVSADYLIEAWVRKVLVRRPREAVPGPSEAVRQLAESRRHFADDGTGSLQGEYAGFASRLVGFLIDSVVLGSSTVVAVWASLLLTDALKIKVTDCPEPESLATIDLCNALLLLGAGLAAAFPSIYALFFWSTTGQSPGKAALGVRIVRLSGEPMNLFVAVRRLVGYALTLATFGVGFASILVDDRRQSWPDKLAGTCVVYSWKARRVGERR